LKSLLLELMQEWDMTPSDVELCQFEEYGRLLAEYNRRMNLVGNAEPEEITVRHFMDSLSLVRMGLKEDSSLIDIGTGAGFPGIPIIIMRPDIKLTLIDSNGKRMDFLRQVKDALGLKEVTVIKARAEELSLTEEYREQYDYATSRAVAGLNMLSELCLPFIKVGGLFCAMKSMDIDEEIQAAKRAIKIMGGEEHRVV
jgi:16S rRNA (guanine527-N7)-methyltransferase